MIAAPPPALVCRACTASTLERMLTDFPPGTVVRVVGGTYRGHFTVGRGVSVEGEQATLDGGGSGTVLTIDGAGARVSGLTIRGSGRDFVGIDAGVRIAAPDVRLENVMLTDNLFGVDVRGAPRALLRGITVEGLVDRPIPLRGDALRLWNSPGARIEENTFKDSRDILVWFSDDSQLVGNRISGCRYGLHSMYESGMSVSANTIGSCEVGSYLMYSKHLSIERNVFAHNRGSTGYGLALKSDDDVVISDNAFVDDHVGVYLDDSPSSIGAGLRVEGNLFAYDGVGFSATPATRGGVVVGNAFVDNLVQAHAAGNGDLRGMTWSRGGHGNYWSDYAGFDTSGRGIGDIPYTAISGFGTLAAQEPALQVFVYSPAAVAVDFATHALPAFAPSIQLVDRAPALRAWLPHDLPWPHRSGTAVPLLGFALLALGGAGAMGAISRRSGRYGLRRHPRAERTKTLSSVPIISAREVCKSYGKTLALADATFQVVTGETLALWGPNGAGKTTLLRCLLGQVSYRGSLTVAGMRPSPRLPAARALMGYAPQSLPDFEMSVAELAAMVGSLRGCDATEIEAALAETGADQARGTAVGALSGGMKQRLNVALALLGEPPILVLDEPTAGLDRASHRSLVELLRERKRLGKTIILTSHDADDVLALADHVAMMEDGRMVSVMGVDRFAALMRRQYEEDAAWHRA
ncbi:nitrous oxide reductase family maturation protein NosD [bacterium]|nr:MAG: nitrous oxide reductase family maturation protein NosD [bacterium]